MSKTSELGLLKPHIIVGLIGGFSLVYAIYAAPFPFYPPINVFLKLILLPVIGFTAGIKAKGMLEHGEVDGFLRYIYAQLAVAVLVSDFIFNVLVGSLIFFERPKEWLFTARVKRHLDSEGYRLKRAISWGKRLNFIDPSPHIRHQRLNNGQVRPC